MAVLSLNMEIRGETERVRIMVVNGDGEVVDQHDGLLRPYALSGDPFVTLIAIPPVDRLYQARVQLDDQYSGTLYPALVHLDEADNVISVQRIPNAQWYVQDGVPRTDLLRRMAPVNENTPGPDTLRLTDADGRPVEGGTVHVYDHTEWHDDPMLASPIATAVSDADGRWVTPILLPTGQTYVVVTNPGGRTPPRVFEMSL